MTDYIAELDETQQIIALWIKEKNDRAPQVFDPKKHVFDHRTARSFHGAPQKDIEDWIARSSSAKTRP